MESRAAAPPPPGRQIWLDGRLVPWQDATVHVLSHSLQRGSLIFDYMSVHETPRGAAIFRLGPHVERFLASARLVGLPLTQSAAQLESAICETVRANPGATAVKISGYIPSIEVDVVPIDDHVAIAIAAYDPVADIVAAKRQPSASPRTECRVWIEKERRNRRPDIIPPQAKTAANYSSPMSAKWLARRAGYDEILLVDEDGCVAEGPTTNVFRVAANGDLVTPPEDTVLLGVTRRSVIELAKHDGRIVREERFRPEELMSAPEVFLTGTTANVLPVTSIDDRPIGDGRPGPVTDLLRKRLLRVLEGRDPAFEHWLTPVTGG